MLKYIYENLAFVWNMNYVGNMSAWCATYLLCLEACPAAPVTIWSALTIGDSFRISHPQGVHLVLLPFSLNALTVLSIQDEFTCNKILDSNANQ